MEEGEYGEGEYQEEYTGDGEEQYDGAQQCGEATTSAAVGSLFRSEEKLPHFIVHSPNTHNSQPKHICLPVCIAKPTLKKRLADKLA